ncbi:MAG: DPP IV N-terminal domain-containing protein [Sandaracinaceae bacterium]|nr:DPP IV N-terminal domain-containing protein [Sandaracinaceae bacterium]
MRILSVPISILLMSTACGSSPSQVRVLPPSHAAEASPQAPIDVSDPSVLENLAITHGFRMGRPEKITWAPDGRSVFFLRSGGTNPSRDLYELDVTTGNEHAFLTASALLSGGTEAVSAEERARRERMRLSGGGITDFRFSPDGGKLLVPYSGRLFLVNRADAQIREIVSRVEGAPVDPRLSPDGLKLSCVRNGDLYVTTLATSNEVRVTRRAGEHITYGEAEFVAQEEMGRFEGYWWSPDSQTLLVEEADTTPVETLHISDPARPEREPTAYPYPRAGHDNVRVRLMLVAATGGRMREVHWDRDAFPYLANVVWSAHHDAMVLVQNRRQNEERLLSVDARTGATQLLITETDQAWLNIDEQMPRVLTSGKFLWTTERNAAWQLELRNADGSLDHAITLPEFGYRSLAHVNESANQVYVHASTDPTQSHLYRVPLTADGNEPVQYSQAAGMHAAIFAKSGDSFVLVSELADGSIRVRAMHDASGEGTDVHSSAEIPSQLPRLEFVEIDEALHLHAVVVRPHNFDPSIRYPVLVAVYGGPGFVNVMQAPYRYLDEQWMADHGFIVVSIDGRGTPNRGRDWERAIARDVITTPLADQVRGLRALGDRFPEMDLAHVGIYGWSFGGYFSAMAVMREPSVFHVAVAGAPVTDWHDYDTHYTERFMGLPSENEEGYRSTSCITWASHLERPLLLVHGTADDNVYFLHSVHLADALLREGKDFAFLPLSGFTHMVPDPAVSRHLNERIYGFLADHLR